MGVGGRGGWNFQGPHLRIASTTGLVPAHLRAKESLRGVFRVLEEARGAEEGNGGVERIWFSLIFWG